MKTICLDSEFRCHLTDDGTMTAKGGTRDDD